MHWQYNSGAGHGGYYCGVLVFGMSVSLYAIIAVYVTALVTDTVLEGTKQARAVWIISDKNEQIAPVVMGKMHRGITRFPASGVYTQQEKSVLLCVVSIKQIPYLKEIVMEIDENSFLIVGDVREVMGNGLYKSYSKSVSIVNLTKYPQIFVEIQYGNYRLIIVLFITTTDAGKMRKRKASFI